MNFIRESAIASCILCLLPVAVYYPYETDILVFLTAEADRHTTSIKCLLKEVSAQSPVVLKEISSNYFSVAGTEQPSETTIPLKDSKD
mgnify:FL=1